MAQHTFMENVHRNTTDWLSTKAAVRAKGVDCPDSTPTDEVAGKIEDIESGVQYEAEYQVHMTQPERLVKAAINISGERIVLNIPSDITTIQAWAFEETRVLFDVALPDGITTLNKNAFASCYGLQNINLPNSITFIGEAAFSGCSNIENIELPNNISQISDSTFTGCRKLKNVTIPDNIWRIGQYAFSQCASLTDIYYNGTQEQWQQISGIENIPSGATIHYNYVPE